MSGIGSNTIPTAFARRINYYVPAMEYAADVHDDGIYKIPLGSPSVADTDAIIDGATITGGVTLSGSDLNGVESSDGLWISDVPFGRALQIVCSGAGTPTVTIKGWDYLGQRMLETRSANGTTPVLFLKAFKRVNEVVVATGITGTIDVGTRDALGLPYKTLSIDAEIADGALQSAGTFVAPVLTDPQTASTGDPRGTYDPTVTLDGTVLVEILATADNWRNADGNGGYHGIKQYWA